MTEDELIEAERSAMQIYPVLRCTTNFSERQAYVRGYADGRESLREDTVDANRFANELGRVRARSGELIRALRVYSELNQDPLRSRIYWFFKHTIGCADIGTLARETIKEYEDSRD